MGKMMMPNLIRVIAGSALLSGPPRTLHGTGVVRASPGDRRQDGSDLSPPLLTHMQNDRMREPRPNGRTHANSTSLGPSDRVRLRSID